MLEFNSPECALCSEGYWKRLTSIFEWESGMKFCIICFLLIIHFIAIGAQQWRCWCPRKAKIQQINCHIYPHLITIFFSIWTFLLYILIFAWNFKWKNEEFILAFEKKWCKSLWNLFVAWTLIKYVLSMIEQMKMRIFIWWCLLSIQWSLYPPYYIIFHGVFCVELDLNTYLHQFLDILFIYHMFLVF